MRNSLYVYIAITILLSACSIPSKNKQKRLLEHPQLQEKLSRNKRNEDSLRLMLQEYKANNDDAALVQVYKCLGSYMRGNNRFVEAIDHHKKGLALALNHKDTIEIVRAYNNIGTDFRRIAAYGRASEYHYEALNYANAYSKVSIPGPGMKNRVIALNGIGNIALVIDNLDEAEVCFRAALKDETLLQSAIGQAINYANLGAVFEQRGQIDSAYYYYNQSLGQNRIAKSDMGIGLCLIHLGNLYEKERKYVLAQQNYQQAYDLMHQISDKWHWLEACLSIARIKLYQNDISKYKYYVSLAEKTANKINSPEHIAYIYKLKHDYDFRQQNYQDALRLYKLYKETLDSVQGVQKSKHYFNEQLRYEQRQASHRIEQIQTQNKIEQQKKQWILYTSWIFIFIGVIFTALLYLAYRQHSRSNKLLRDMEEARSSFFTNITHEFRTPITVIQGFNRLLDDKKELSEAERANYHQAIERQSKSLLNLVNQLLDISKLRAGMDMPNWRHGDIVPFLQMISETFALYAERKKVKLVFFSNVKSLEMDFIPFYLDKIVSNLLSNAIKHTHSGDKIHLAILAMHRDTVSIRVTDTGEGIAKEDLEKIFEVFYQSPSAKNTSGTGIGLSFAQLMTQKMNGKIKVESEIGNGASFTITLPLKNKQIENIETLQSNDEEYPVTGEVEVDDLEVLTEDEVHEDAVPIVLIVEDNKDILTYISTLLSDKYSVLSARNGQEALAIAEQYIPDIVITDIMMPVKDGMQLCCEMKQHLMLNHIPVIMLTAKSGDQDRVEGLKCGAAAFIKKPFQADELLVCIHNLLENRKRIIEKYSDIVQYKLLGEDEDDNVKCLRTIANIVSEEIQNPELNTDFIADKMAMSPSQLNRKLNAITGCSVVSYILKLKLERSKIVLQNASLSIADVAFACGFYDANYFSRVFKKEFLVSPSQYRKQVDEK